MTQGFRSASAKSKTYVLCAFRSYHMGEDAGLQLDQPRTFAWVIDCFIVLTSSSDCPSMTASHQGLFASLLVNVWKVDACGTMSPSITGAIGSIGGSFCHKSSGATRSRPPTASGPSTPRIRIKAPPISSADDMGRLPTSGGHPPKNSKRLANASSEKSRRPVETS